MEGDEPGPSHGHNLRKRPPKTFVHVPIKGPKLGRKLTKQKVRKGKIDGKIQKILDDMKTNQTKAPSMKEIGEILAKKDDMDEDPYEKLWDSDE